MNRCYAKMATSSQREGGREPSPPTPGQPLTEKKHQTSDNDIQKLFGHHKERPNEPHGWSSTWKQPPHVKEQDMELKITHDGERHSRPEEADLSTFPLTGVSVKTEDHEDKPPESLRWLCPSDVEQLTGFQKEYPPRPQCGTSTLKQEVPQPLQVKEEEEELWITQEGECFIGLKETDVTKLPLTVVSVKTEDHEDEPLESSSEENMTTEADGDHCGGSQADNLLAPLSDSDDTTSHSADDTQEPLSSDTDWEGDMRTQTDDNRSKKKTGTKHFTCSVCAKTFSRQSNLTQHMLMHTGERPFACSLCGKSYSYRKSLTYHMLTHTAEKPLSCSLCGHRFTQKSSMISHMRRHTIEKPFGCSVCGKRFPTKTRLVAHKKTHRGQTLFSCSVCGKNYTYKYLSKFHMIMHSKEDACQEEEEEEESASDNQPKHYWNQKGFEWSF
uniref:zinc finger and SCAN domain-containing protein 12-like n=1 Tax=Doryrhamphus excisus TaxID=161450 RepID=UPI0025AE8F0C|nr:zinc finger and SCAN domain-containing protein 12-like [Doryrhamphus excisus]